MYFLSNVFRIGKLIIAGVGLIAGGGVLIYGAVTAAPLFAAGGAMYFVTSLLLVFDASKVLQDIKKEIDRMKVAITTFQEENKKLALERMEFEKNNQTFSANNDILRLRVEALCKAEKELEEQNESLARQVVNVKAQLDRLDQLKKQYEQENAELQKLSKTFGTENEILRKTAEKMSDTQTALKEENQKLNELLDGVKGQLIAMEKAKRNYEEENAKYKHMLQENEALLQKSQTQIDGMTTQIIKLKELHESSKQLIRNLVEAGDLFTNFSATLGQDVSKLDNVTGDITTAAQDLNSTIQRLNMQLTKQEFEQADADGDGMVTQDEWGQYVDKKN